jgi:isopentenyldiphosphate isomerase
MAAEKNEKVAVVNQQDEVIGWKWRADLTDDDCWRIVSLWLENDQDQVLLQQRSWDKKLERGHWSPAAVGTVLLGHGYEDTALREAEEEIGLRGVALEVIKKTYLKGPLGWRQEVSFHARCNWPIKQFTPQTEEVANLAWVDKAELMAEIRGEKPHSRDYVSTFPQWPEIFDLELA